MGNNSYPAKARALVGFFFKVIGRNKFYFYIWIAIMAAGFSWSAGLYLETLIVLCFLFYYMRLLWIMIDISSECTIVDIVLFML